MTQPSISVNVGRLPERVVVLGGGRMGAGIAHAFLVSGCTVAVLEADPAAVARARERVLADAERSIHKGLLAASMAQVAGRLRVVAAMSQLPVDADLVIEAVPEDIALKERMLRLAEEQAPAAVLATNTSSLSVDAIAVGLRRPERFIGLHFFNPVPASGLVEIVVGARTGEQLVVQAADWVTALGKTAITVRDSPGFASSRLGIALAMEAIRMVEEGVASAADIDAAMTLGYRHPVGPLRTTDIVGLDVRLAIAEHLAAELGPRFQPPDLLRRMVADGQLGRKSGQGFFAWSGDVSG